MANETSSGGETAGGEAPRPIEVTPPRISIRPTEIVQNGTQPDRDSFFLGRVLRREDVDG